MSATENQAAEAQAPETAAAGQAPTYKAGSNLEKILSEGRFAVTGECGPPKSADGGVIAGKAQLLKGYVDAVNITDNQTAVVRVCSMVSAFTAQQNGVEAIMQMTCRDRNRLAMQADILGASTLGIKNILCLTGDHMSFGNHPAGQGCARPRRYQPDQDVQGHAGRQEVPIRRGDDGGAAALYRVRREPVRRPVRDQGPSAQEEDRGRRRLRPDPVHLQHPQVQDGGWKRCVRSACTRRSRSWPASRLSRAAGWPNT